MDWDKVPVSGGVEQTSSSYLASEEARRQEALNQQEAAKSVLSPSYRPRSAFGGQELGGLAGSVLGGIAGLPAGPMGVYGGSVLGAGIGGALGETAEQKLREEPLSAARISQAGLEEAAWDAGGNLVLKSAGKLLKIGADKLGFTSKDVPDATLAANEFLKQQGSSLPKATMSTSPFLETATSMMYTPATAGIYKAKEKEIGDALESGAQNLLKQFTTSPDFAMALKQGTSAQKASGQVLQGFIKEGETALSDAVKPLYDKIWGDKDSKVSMFPLVSYAKRELADPAKLTAGQKSILKELENLPPTVDIKTLHDIRSRWLAENRDKYSSMGTEKDSRAVSTISSVISKLDEAADFSAERTLSPDTLRRYKSVTKRYREGIQGLNTEAVQEAMKLDPEQVGSYLFQSGRETPVNDLYKSIATAGKLSGKSSKEVMDSLRYGYMQAATNTPENILKFANNLEQDQAAKNTFNVMFDDKQKQAITAMADAAKLGLVSFKPIVGSSVRTTGALYGAGAAGAGLTYAFLLSPEQQARINDNLGSAALSAGALVLNQRTLAKMLLDPQGAKAIKYLSTAKDKLTSPSAFTKLVVEPIMNFYSPTPEEGGNLFQTSNKAMDWSKVPVGQ